MTETQFRILRGDIALTAVAGLLCVLIILGLMIGFRHSLATQIKTQCTEAHNER